MIDYILSPEYIDSAATIEAKDCWSRNPEFRDKVLAVDQAAALSPAFVNTCDEMRARLGESWNTEHAPACITAIFFRFFVIGMIAAELHLLHANSDLERMASASRRVQ